MRLDTLLLISRVGSRLRVFPRTVACVDGSAGTGLRPWTTARAAIASLVGPHRWHQSRFSGALWNTFCFRAIVSITLIYFLRSDFPHCPT